MKRFATACAAGFCALVIPAVAPGMVADFGTTATSLTPACPAKPCYAISKTTGFQAKLGDDRSIHVVPADGTIVAWSITLSKPTDKQIKFFDTSLGGESTAQLTVLRGGNKQYYRVVAQGDPIKMEPYFGQKVQFPLAKSIPVKKGYVIAITVPTWVPAMQVNLPSTSSWRASRNKGSCDDFDTQSAQMKTGNIARWYCLYRTAGLAYGATIISRPVTTAKLPKAPA
jgi:hypothetical protein